MYKKESLLKVKVYPNGPILVDGTVIEKENPHFCRCGASKNKPYCDGSHVKIGFKD